MAMRQGRRRHETAAARFVTSIRWSWLIAALAGGLIWTAPALAERGSTSPAARAPTAAHGNFARRVAIRGGRKLYLECRGKGSPTVVLEAGTGDLAQDLERAAGGPGPAVLPAVADLPGCAPTTAPGTFELPDRAQPQRPGRDAAERARHRPRPARAAARRPCPGPLRTGRPLVRRHGRAPLRHHPPPEGRRPGLDRRPERGLRRRLQGVA